MASQCPSFLRGRRARFTRLDACGNPIAGACNQLVTKSLVTVSMSPEVQEAESIDLRSFDGEPCLVDAGCDTVNWLNLSMEFCALPLDVIGIINPSWRTIRNRAGDISGWGEKGQLSCDTGYALELWVGVKGASVCDDPNAQGAYGYLLLPWVVGGAVGDLEITNGAVTFTFAGRTQLGSRWGVGPYNVELDGATPVPLGEPVQADEHRVFVITGLAPPEPECACQPVPAISPPPTVAITRDETDATGKTISVTGTLGTTGNTMSIDWGDGSPVVPLVTATPLTHAYTCATTCVFTVTVREKIANPPAGGASETTVSRVITIPFL